jgi:leader peptidase (prepilin peptidase) / N-methyltransferase
VSTPALETPVALPVRAPTLGWCALGVVGVAAAWVAAPLVLLVWMVPVAWAASIDARAGRLPDRIVLPGIAVVLSAVVVSASWAGWSGLAGPVGGAALLSVPFLLLHLATPAGFGFGDVKFGVLLGLGLGVVNPGLVLVVFASAAVLQLIVARSRPWPAQRKARVDRRSAPFGPSLAIASTGWLLVHLALEARR